MWIVSSTENGSRMRRSAGEIVRVASRASSAVGVPTAGEARKGSGTRVCERGCEAGEDDLLCEREKTKVHGQPRVPYRSAALTRGHTFAKRCRTSRARCPLLLLGGQTVAGRHRRQMQWRRRRTQRRWQTSRRSSTLKQPERKQVVSERFHGILGQSRQTDLVGTQLQHLATRTCSSHGESPTV